MKLNHTISSYDCLRLREMIMNILETMKQSSGPGPEVGGGGYGEKGVRRTPTSEKKC